MLLIDSSYYEIKHTEQKGRGVFARKTIKPGTVIGDYLGKIIPNEDEIGYEKNIGLYVMKFDETRCIQPDEKGNDGAHILNHSCEENCAIIQYKNHNILFALRTIFPREELTYHYSISPGDIGVIEPYICFCGSPLCCGVMTNSEQEDELWLQFEKNPIFQNFLHVNNIKDYSILTPLGEYPTPEFILNAVNGAVLYPIFGAAGQKEIESQESFIPNYATIRMQIMESGKPIYFPKMRLLVRGVKNNQLICEYK